MNLVESTVYPLHCGMYSRCGLAGRDICTGCTVCAAVCPTDAITMSEDAITHFFYPVVDEAKCIRCRRCRKICPALDRSDLNPSPLRVYAAINRAKKERMISASGGIFRALASDVLMHGGAVAGVRYVGISRCQHHVITDMQKLDELCGSKYFQSEMNCVYDELRMAAESLENPLMFCGTPCQTEAVRRYAKAMGFEKRLLSVDVLCRGIPSAYVQQKFIEHMEKKYTKKIVSYRMKEKTMGWDQIGMLFGFDDGNNAYEKGQQTAYGKAFMESNLAIRNSCFHCPYKTTHRSSDITIGDFWGYRNSHLLDNLGTSFILLNTEKGETALKRVSHRLDMRLSTLWRVYKGNRPGFEKVDCNMEKRRIFWESLNRGEDLGSVVERLLKGE